MAEPKPVSARRLQLEDRLDRWLPEKLAQAYPLLVPDRRRPIAASASLYCIGGRWFLAGAENGTDVMREGSLF